MKNVNGLLRRCAGDTNGESSMRRSLSNESLLYPTVNGNVFSSREENAIVRCYLKPSLFSLTQGVCTVRSVG